MILVYFDIETSGVNGNLFEHLDGILEIIKEIIETNNL